MVVGLTTSKRTPPTTSRTPSRPLRTIPTAKARSSRSPDLNQFIARYLRHSVRACAAISEAAADPRHSPGALVVARPVRCDERAPFGVVVHPVKDPDAQRLLWVTRDDA